MSLGPHWKGNWGPLEMGGGGMMHDTQDNREEQWNTEPQLDSPYWAYPLHQGTLVVQLLILYHSLFLALKTHQGMQSATAVVCSSSCRCIHSSELQKANSSWFLSPQPGVCVIEHGARIVSGKGCKVPFTSIPATRSPEEHIVWAIFLGYISPFSNSMFNSGVLRCVSLKASIARCQGEASPLFKALNVEPNSTLGIKQTPMIHLIFIKYRKN